MGECAVDESFLEGFVTVFVLDVLADDGDGDFVLGVVGAVDDVLPLGEVGGAGVDAQVMEQEVVEASTPKLQSARPIPVESFTH